MLKTPSSDKLELAQRRKKGVCLSIFETCNHANGSTGLPDVSSNSNQKCTALELLFQILEEADENKLYRQDIKIAYIFNVWISQNYRV